MAELSRIGKYEIRRELGRGAMGVVYEGYDPMIKRIVALKTIRADQLAGENARGHDRPLPPRSAGRGTAVAPQHRLHLRHRRGRGRLVHRDGVRQGPRAQGLLRGERAVRARRHRADHDADPGRARLLAQARRHPPRHQARERHPARRRRRQGRRFRHRAHRVVEHDAGGLGARHAELHVARADHGPSRRRPLGSLLRRRHPLPVPDRRAPVQRLVHRHDAQGAGGRPAAAVAVQRAGARRDGCRGAQGAGEAPGRALSDRRRVRRRIARRSAASGLRGRSDAAGAARAGGASGARRCHAHRKARACGRRGRHPGRRGTRAAAEEIADDRHRHRCRRRRHRRRRRPVGRLPAQRGRCREARAGAGGAPPPARPLRRRLRLARRQRPPPPLPLRRRSPNAAA